MKEYIILIILGYFTVKIFGAFLKIYPQYQSKYEIINFIVLLNLSLLLFYFSEKNHILNMFFIISYIFGLFLSLFIKNIDNFVKNDNISFIYLIIIFGIIILSIFFNGFKNIYSYGLQIIIPLILLIGFFMTKRKDNIIKLKDENYFLYDNNQEIIMSFTFIAYLISFLFVNSENKILLIANGLFLGIFVGGMAINGFDYFFQDVPTHKSDNCPEHEIGEKVYNNLNSTLEMMKWVLSFVILILIALIIVFYYSRFTE